MQQTIKKLSLEPADSEGFQTVSFEKVEGPKTALTSPEVLSPRMGTFSYPRSTWESLMNDPSVRGEWEGIVQERVTERLTSESAEYRKRIEQDAREEGVRQGLALAAQAIEGSQKKIEMICRAVVEKQAEILRSHERAWGEAMAHLLRRFLVPNAGSLAADLKAWLEESLEGFSAKGKLRVRLSPSEYDAIFETLAAGSSWELVRDESLKEGEIHAETDAGGIFFSPSREAEKLEELIAHFFPKGGRHA